jgi:hypothetical protein
MDDENQQLKSHLDHTSIINASASPVFNNSVESTKLPDTFFVDLQQIKKVYDQLFQVLKGKSVTAAVDEAGKAAEAKAAEAAAAVDEAGKAAEAKAAKVAAEAEAAEVAAKDDVTIKEYSTALSKYFDLLQFLTVDDITDDILGLLRSISSTAKLSCNSKECLAISYLVELKNLVKGPNSVNNTAELINQAANMHQEPIEDQVAPGAPAAQGAPAAVDKTKLLDLLQMNCPLDFEEPSAARGGGSRDSDEISMLGGDPLFLVLSEFFMTKGGKNIADVLEEINQGLKEFQSLPKKKGGKWPF